MVESWRIKGIAAGLAGVLLLMSGCSESVETVRQEALSRLKEMIYIGIDQDDNPYNNVHEIEREIQEATEIDAIRRLMQTAEEIENTEKNSYWVCAMKRKKDLPGTVWVGNGLTGSGPDLMDNEYLLRLDKTGKASLEVTKKGKKVKGRPNEGDEWLAGLAGKVTGWKADLDEVVRQRRYAREVGPGGKNRPMFDRVETSWCEVPFALTLSTTSGEQKLEAAMDISSLPDDPEIDEVELSVERYKKSFDLKV